MTWRDIAKPIIAGVLAANADAPSPPCLTLDIHLPSPHRHHARASRLAVVVVRDHGHTSSNFVHSPTTRSLQNAGRLSPA